MEEPLRERIKREIYYQIGNSIPWDYAKFRDTYFEYGSIRYRHCMELFFYFRKELVKEGLVKVTGNAYVRRYSTVSAVDIAKRRMRDS